MLELQHLRESSYAFYEHLKEVLEVHTGIIYSMFAVRLWTSGSGFSSSVSIIRTPFILRASLIWSSVQEFYQVLDLS